MNVSSALIAILTALLLGAISPGPSFILVVRSSLGLSRRDGLATAIGMGVGESASAASRWRASIRC